MLLVKISGLLDVRYIVNCKDIITLETLHISAIASTTTTSSAATALLKCPSNLVTLFSSGTFMDSSYCLQDNFIIHRVWYIKAFLLTLLILFFWTFIHISCIPLRLSPSYFPMEILLLSRSSLSTTSFMNPSQILYAFQTGSELSF